jgi:Domain of unknown function (DUF4177)
MTSIQNQQKCKNEKTISFKTALLGTLVGIAAMLCIAANPIAELPTQKWEYRVLELGVAGAGGEKEINQLGREGWELVSESSFVISHGQYLSGTAYHTFVLKRQLAK